MKKKKVLKITIDFDDLVILNKGNEKELKLNLCF